MLLWVVESASWPELINSQAQAARRLLAPVAVTSVTSEVETR
jgi:hypothetical protein